jgi:hypothetical protein
MKSHCAINYSINFVVNENCFNKFVFMNQLIIVLIFLTMIINCLKFVVSFFLSMLFFLCEWLRHCRTMYLTFCLIQSQKHVDETTFDIFCWINNQSILFNLYEFALLNCFRISSIFHAILIFLIVISFINVKQKLRECFVWYVTQICFHLTLKIFFINL